MFNPISLTRNQAIGIAVFCSFLGATGQFFLKMARDPFNALKFLIGAGLYGIAFVLYFLAMKALNLTVIYPIIALTYIWVGIYGAVFLKESFPLIKYIGTALIIVGLILITRGGS